MKCACPLSFQNAHHVSKSEMRKETGDSDAGRRWARRGSSARLRLNRRERFAVFLGVLRVAETGVESHGPCESLERSIVRIGLEMTEIRVKKRNANRVPVVGGRCMRTFAANHCTATPASVMPKLADLIHLAFATGVDDAAGHTLNPSQADEGISLLHKRGGLAKRARQNLSRQSRWKSR